MATRTFINNAVAVKDVWTITVANTWAQNDTATVTINGKNLVVTIGTVTTTAGVATTIKEAFSSGTFTDTDASCIPQGGGQSIPEMKEYVATVSGSTVILTARTAGMPGTISSSESTAGSGTASIAHTTTGTGPYDASNTANWAEGAVPVDSDDVLINGPYKMLTGLGMSSVQPASITFGTRCTAATQIGLPDWNAAGYQEYRATEWAIGGAIVDVYGAVGLVKINNGTDALAASVYASGTSLETGFAPVQLRGTHASVSVKVYGGTVGYAMRGETATLATALQSGSGVLNIGNGTTLTTISGTVTVSPV